MAVALQTALDSYFYKRKVIFKSISSKLVTGRSVGDESISFVSIIYMVKLSLPDEINLFPPVSHICVRKLRTHWFR